VQSFLFSRPLEVSVSAKSAILINADNGKILFAKNIDDLRPPGSTTKIATCLFSLQRIKDLEEQIKAPMDCLIKIPHKVKQEREYRDVAYRLEPDGTSYGIYAGESLSIKNLLYGLMLSSGNDAANVLAHHLSEGNITAYMEDLNEYLHSIGCLSTTFFNPHGLHYPQHLTTARDLATLAREAIKHPLFLDIIQTQKHERPKTNKQAPYTVWTRNQLLRKGPFYYPKAFGIKTGYHAAAGHVFVGAARDEYRTLISVVLGSSTRDEKFRDTIKLFDAAFAEKRLARHLLNKQESIFRMKVKGAKKSLQAGLQEDIIMHYFPSEEEELFPKLIWNSLTLPIKKGQTVGALQINTEQGKTVRTEFIYAIEDLDFARAYKMVHWLLCWKHGGFLLGAILTVSIALTMYKRKIVSAETK